MDSIVVTNQRENCCLMFCILKTVLFAVIAVFMLFLPLGDPNVACHSKGLPHNGGTAMCHLCEGYFLIVKATGKAMELLDFALRVALDVLYEAKLKFYAFLERLDKRDLCGSVCCTLDDEPNFEESKESRCPQCKCVRKKCRPKSESRLTQL